MPAKDNTICPEIPGSRYVINKSMAWALIGLTALTGFGIGFFVAILATTT